MDKIYEHSILPFKYYSCPRYLPKPEAAKFNKISHESSTKACDNIRLIYISSGKGHVVINGKNDPIEPGCCLILRFYHFYRFKPDAGESIELFEVDLSNETYHFMVTIPGSKLHKYECTDCYYSRVLSKEDAIEVNKLFGYLQEKYKLSVLNNIYLFELMSIIFDPAHISSEE